VISGSPTSASPQGNYTVTVTDIAAHTATAAFTLTINPVVTATQAQASAALTEALATSPFTPVTATGGTGTLTYSIHPSLPIGLSFASASGSITGTASVPLAATTYTVTATDTNGATASANFLLTVNPPVLATVVVAEKTLTQNQPATPFQPVAATGGTGALHYSVTPALPSGLSISSTSGVVSGTPAAANASTTYTITATDTNGAAKSATFSLSISGAVVASQTIASKALTLNQVAPSFTPVVATGGTGALTYAVTPALPTGLSLSASTGAISGTPTVAIPAMTYTVTATDSNGASSSAPFSLNVQSVPVQQVQTGQVTAGSTLVLHVTANAAGAPFTAVTISSPPSAGTAMVSGLDIVYIPPATVTTTQTVTFTYTINNAYGTSSPITVTLTVSPIGTQISRDTGPPPSKRESTLLSAGGAA
jgi:hypothetical protein